jgi:hypothetical protein
VVEPLETFLAESAARLTLLMTSSGQVVAQHGFSRSVDVMTAAALGAGTAASALLIATVCAFSAAALKVADLGDDNLTLALYQLSGLLGAGAGFAFAVVLGAASCSGARSGALPPWLYWLGSVAAVAQLLTGLALVVSSGFFGIGEPFALIAFVIAAVWLVSVSVLMMRRHGVPPVARTEP